MTVSRACLIASGRLIGVGWRAIQASSAASCAGGMRTMIPTAPFGFGPRFFDIRVVDEGTITLISE